MKLGIDTDKILEYAEHALDLIRLGPAFGPEDESAGRISSYFAGLQNEIDRNLKLIEDRLNGDTPAERSEGDVRTTANGGSRSEADK